MTTYDAAEPQGFRDRGSGVSPHLHPAKLPCAYDARGAWLVMPSVQYVREPFRFGLQYAAVMGNFVSFGALRDRDQIAFTFAYLLN